MWSKRDSKKLRKTFRSQAEAKAWRADATTQINRGTLRSPARITLHAAAEEWTEGAKDGTVTNSAREVYKPSVIRGYEAALRNRIPTSLALTRIRGSRKCRWQREPSDLAS